MFYSMESMSYLDNDAMDSLINEVFCSILLRRHSFSEKPLFLTDIQYLINNKRYDELTCFDQNLLSKVSTRFDRIIEKIENRENIYYDKKNATIENVLDTHFESSDHIKPCLDDSHGRILNGIINEIKAIENSLFVKVRRKFSKQKRLSAQKQQHMNPENVKYLKQYPDDYWPKADNGFFCLLRGFLTKGGERKLLSTAQICEYVREWQIYKGQKLVKAGLNCNWINRVEDWSSITPQALNFLSAESVLSNSEVSPGISVGIRHSSRRLQCPRPFVNFRSRTHQWSWLLNPTRTAAAVSQQHAECDSTNKFKSDFDAEMHELCSLFSDWLRAPRGLGGLTDAVLSVSDYSSFSKSSSNAVQNTMRRRKVASRTFADLSADRRHSDEDDSRENDCRGFGRRGGNDDESVDCDSQLSGQGRLKIVDLCQSNEAHGDELQSDSKRRRSSHLGQTSSRTNTEDGVSLPLYSTSWKLRPFTTEEKIDFQMQETDRFDKPWIPFVYHVQDYRAVVGPLRSAPSVYDKQAQAQISSWKNVHSSSGSKAREHPLLKLNRPIYVNLAEIVRDAVACLPNGEGTRADITILVQNSGYLLPNINPRQLQQCISSALDRLQSETNDPSVYFNASQRSWIYRHRGRSVEEFAELHEARCAMNQAKKAIQRGMGSTISHNSNFSVGRNFSRSKQAKQVPLNQPISFNPKHQKYMQNFERPSVNPYPFGSRRVTRDYGYYPIQVGHDTDGNSNKDYSEGCNYQKCVSVYSGDLDTDKEFTYDDDYIPDIDELEAQEMYGQSLMNPSCSDTTHELIGVQRDDGDDNNDNNDNNDEDGDDLNYSGSIKQSVYDYDANRKSFYSNFTGNCKLSAVGGGSSNKRIRPLLTSRKLCHSSNTPSILSRRRHATESGRQKPQFQHL